MANYCWVYGLIHFTSPAGWLPVHRDQLRAQRSVTSMGKLYLYLFTAETCLTDCWWWYGYRQRKFVIVQVRAAVCRWPRDRCCCCCCYWSLPWRRRRRDVTRSSVGPAGVRRSPAAGRAGRMRNSRAHVSVHRRKFASHQVGALSRHVLTDSGMKHTHTHTHARTHESVPKIITNDTVNLFSLNCNQNFGNFKPQQCPSAVW